MAFAAIAVAALSAYSAYSQDKAKADAADFNAQVANENAQISLSQGQAAAEAQERDSKRQLGSMIAAYGASGAQVDTGSPAEVLGDSIRLSTLDNLSIKYNYGLRARGFSKQAEMENRAASHYRTSAILNGVSAGARSYFGMGGTIPSFGGSASASSTSFMNSSIGANGM